jgi:geranylgeranyl diphosphate synthase type I
VTAPDLRARIDKALQEFLHRATPPLGAIAPDLQELADAGEQFVLDGGKRLRPTFCYWGYRATGADDDDRIVTAAAALELLQACALMHDDVIDGSDTRRGAPSVHRRFGALHRTAGWHGDSERFGEAAAILLGDLALIWADTMLADSGFDAVTLQRAWPVWDAMRVEVMCGQYLDVVEQARGGGSVERALRVARFKSAKYTVERPLHLGVVLGRESRGGGDDDLLAVMSRFGLPLGEAFQLRDDVLGVFGDPDVTGKPAGDDVREGKRTTLVAFATEAATPAQATQLRRHLGDPQLDATGLDVVRDVLTSTGALARVEEQITTRTAEALAALDGASIDAEAEAELRRLVDVASRRAG